MANKTFSHSFISPLVTPSELTAFTHLHHPEKNKPEAEIKNLLRAPTRDVLCGSDKHSCISNTGYSKNIVWNLDSIALQSNMNRSLSSEENNKSISQSSGPFMHPKCLVPNECIKHNIPSKRGKLRKCYLSSLLYQNKTHPNLRLSHHYHQNHPDYKACDKTNQTWNCCQLIGVRLK